ncbi:PREDICTED: protein roadkill-like [Diuraphis noxia]|uniref:protein roadkill-like n=1 Tax=Diuraphis noxia TaxID=143948 RepID=UPI00076386E5|nr:PREDICTED: protein roadkill-like [Diuraphis noxia]
MSLPVVSECSPQQTARVSVAAGSSGSVNAAASAAAAAAAAVVAGAPSSSTMSVSRVPSPPPSSEANTPVAENWCYTQPCDRRDGHYWLENHDSVAPTPNS